MRCAVQRFFACLGVVGALAALSCGSSEDRLPETGATLEGTVKYKGKQLWYAMIIVITDSGFASGTIGEDGKYQVENVPLGEVRIGVNTAAARGQYMSRTQAHNANPNTRGKPMPPFEEVPSEFYDPETSRIRTAIREGANAFDIVIE